MRLTANRILVIDDDPLISKILERGLQKHGYTVAVGRHGTDAGYLALEFKPDLVILDIMLPDIDGEEICKRIRSNNEIKDVKIISISAVANKEKIEAMHKAGINLFIPKPFEIAKVAEEIVNLVGPIRERRRSFWKYQGLKVTAAGGIIVLAALVVVMFYVLGGSDSSQVAEGMTKLKELAEFINKHDGNGDQIVTKLEVKDLKSFDTNQDEVVSTTDGAKAFEELMAECGQATEKLGKEQWLELGGTAAEHRLFDCDKNGALSKTDFEKQDIEVVNENFKSVVDPRNNQPLALDPVQLQWFDQIVAADEKHLVLWQGRTQPKEYFDNAEYVTAETIRDRERLEGFLTVTGDAKKGTFTLIERSGDRRIGNIADLDNCKPVEDSIPMRWYAKYAHIAPDDSARWRELANELREYPFMRHQCENAAQRALIYNRKLKGLYRIVGVVLEKGRLVLVEQDGDE